MLKKIILFILLISNVCFSDITDNKFILGLRRIFQNTVTFYDRYIITGKNAEDLNFIGENIFHVKIKNDNTDQNISTKDIENIISKQYNVNCFIMENENGILDVFIGY